MGTSPAYATDSKPEWWFSDDERERTGPGSGAGCARCSACADQHAIVPRKSTGSGQLEREWSVTRPTDLVRWSAVDAVVSGRSAVAPMGTLTGTGGGSVATHRRSYPSRSGQHQPPVGQHPDDQGDDSGPVHLRPGVAGAGARARAPVPLIDATFAIVSGPSPDPRSLVHYVSLSSAQTAHLCDDLGSVVTVREKGSTKENTIKRYIGRYDIQISGVGGADPVITVGTGELIIDLDVTRDGLMTDQIVGVEVDPSVDLELVVSQTHDRDQCEQPGDHDRAGGQSSAPGTPGPPGPPGRSGPSRWCVRGHHSAARTSSPRSSTPRSGSTPTRRVTTTGPSGGSPVLPGRRARSVRRAGLRVRRDRQDQLDPSDLKALSGSWALSGLPGRRGIQVQSARQAPQALLGPRVLRALGCPSRAQWRPRPTCRRTATRSVTRTSPTTPGTCGCGVGRLE